MSGTRIIFFIVGIFCTVGGIYMIVTKKPVLFHRYHYANMPAEARGKFAVYGGLGSFILGMGFVGLLLHRIGWPIWMKGEYGNSISIAVAIIGGAILILSFICCKKTHDFMDLALARRSRKELRQLAPTLREIL